MDVIAELYRDACRRSRSIVSCRLLSSPDPKLPRVEVCYTHESIERNQSVKFCQDGFLKPDGHHGVIWCAPTEAIDALKSYSLSGFVYAVVKNMAPGKASGASQAPEKSDFIEVWDVQRACLTTVINTKAAKQHGVVHTDPIFGTLAWSAAEGHLAYVAERKDEPKGWFDPDPGNGDEKGTGENRGTQFVMKENWGEQLTKVSSPVICIADVASGGITVLDNIRSDISPCAAVWDPQDSGLVFVGLLNDPVKLGRIYCPIRPSGLFHYSIDSAKLMEIGPSAPKNGGQLSFETPRFSPDGRFLAYLECPAGGPHFKGRRLQLMNWDGSKSVKTLLDLIDRPDSGASFPGLYASGLSDRCWSKDSRFIFLTTIWHSKTEIIAVSIADGSFVKISDQDFAPGSWRYHDCSSGVILASVSSCSTPPRFLIAEMVVDPIVSRLKWRYLDEGYNQGSADQMEEQTQISHWQTFWTQPSQDHHTEKFGGLSFESILITPSEGENWPLIVNPHGGPHSCYLVEHLYRNDFLLKAGFALLKPNYRGSVGFGEDCVNSLSGNISTNDVNDVYDAIQHALKLEPRLNRRQIVVLGGSHGGFLTLHLLAQFNQGIFKAGAALNPVMDLVAKSSTTDIPDWTVSCALGRNMTDIKPLTDEELKILNARSPHSRVDQVRAPLMLVLSTEDKRVPPNHGLGYIRCLKALGTEHIVLRYPDNCHPVEQVDASADMMVNVVKWFNKHLGRAAP